MAQVVHQSFEHSDNAERRRTPRLQEEYPARVRGVNCAGQSFEATTTLDNLGAGGLYVHLDERVDEDATLFAVVRLSTAPPERGRAPCVAVRGKVVRVEQCSDGKYGIAVAFTSHRFL